jgi:hypothetical protein
MLFPCRLGGDFDMLLYGKFANLGGGLIMTVCCHVHDDCDITIVMNNVLRENMMAQTPYLDEYLGTIVILLSYYYHTRFHNRSPCTLFPRRSALHYI